MKRELPDTVCRTILHKIVIATGTKYNFAFIRIKKRKPEDITLAAWPQMDPGSLLTVLANRVSTDYRVMYFL